MSETCRLTELTRGASAEVVDIDASQAPRLSALGLRRGVVLSVEQDAPLGGPRIVRVGPARIALARSVARSIRVREGPCP